MTPKAAPKSEVHGLHSHRTGVKSGVHRGMKQRTCARFGIRSTILSCSPACALRSVFPRAPRATRTSRPRPWMAESDYSQCLRAAPIVDGRCTWGSTRDLRARLVAGIGATSRASCEEPELAFAGGGGSRPRGGVQCFGVAQRLPLGLQSWIVLSVARVKLCSAARVELRPCAAGILVRIRARRGTSHDVVMGSGSPRQYDI